MDTNELRKLSLKSISETKFFPPQGERRLSSMIRARPDWCISRQRSWNTPLCFVVHKKTGALHPKQFEISCKISKKINTAIFQSVDNLLENVEAVSIVTPTSTHRDVAEKCIKKGKHVFIEKPITTNVEDAEYLIELSKKHNVIIQVGHIERFNPALQNYKQEEYKT